MKLSQTSLLRPALAVAVAAAALLLLIPAARSETAPVAWSSATPPTQTRFDVKVGSPVVVKLAASTTAPGSVVHIAPAGVALPKGTSFDSSDGSVARATFRFTPAKPGDYRLRFAATSDAGTAPTLSYVVHAEPLVTYPLTVTLTDDKIAHWAVVLRRAVARVRPTPSSHPVTTLDTITTDETQNIVLVLGSLETKQHQVWYRVRLPILPNNSTGWVRAGYLGELYAVHTHLYVDRAHFTATLKRDGKTIFKTSVGVGKPYWPTPRGEFYVRDKLTGFADAAYGPIAFGTSARSGVLTDWPGGGFIGVHGTDEPGVLPGRVSHGCIRMRNDAILRLAQLMPVGTPLTVT